MALPALYFQDLLVFRNTKYSLQSIHENAKTTLLADNIKKREAPFSQKYIYMGLSR
jgi:hypothetical protein